MKNFYKALSQRKWLLSILVIGLGILALVPHEVLAQKLTLDLGSGSANTAADSGEAGTGSLTGKVVQTVALLTVLSLAPSILMMMTSFTRIIVVFSFLRSAIGTQQTPPNAVLISLALFLTLFIMMPTFQQSYDQGIRPLMNEEMAEMEAMEKAVQPFKSFMLKHTREKDLQLFVEINKAPSKKRWKRLCNWLSPLL